MTKIEWLLERRERLSALRKAGMNNREIAAQEAITPQRVSQLLPPVNSPSPILLQVYRYIQRRNKKLELPTYEEIASRFPSNGKLRSTSVVRYWLDRMEELKMIKPRIPKRARDIRTLPLDKRNPKIKAMLEAEKNGR